MAILRPLRNPLIAVWVACLVLVAGTAQEGISDGPGMEDLLAVRGQDSAFNPKMSLEEMGQSWSGDLSLEGKKHSASEGGMEEEDLGEGMEMGMMVCDKTFCKPKGQSEEAVFTPDAKPYIKVAVMHKPEVNFKVTFEAMAKNDVHVGLSNDANFRGGRDKMYEVVIGGWKNKQSVIRPRMSGPNRVAVKGQHLAGSSFDNFWIKKVGNTISVGRAGKSKPFMSRTFSGNEVVHNIRYIGVHTGWGSTGSWKKIEVEKVEYAGAKAKWGDISFQREQTKGQVTPDSTWKACQASGMRPVCERENSFDGRCQVVKGNWKSQDIAKGTFLYRSRADGNRPRMNPGNHQANSNDRDGEVLCTPRPKTNDNDFTYQHYKLHRVAVKGDMNGNNIVNACEARGMKPVCDHQNYKDKRCTNVGNSWHFSHSSHNKQHGIDVNKVKFAFFYTKNGNRALMNTGRGHRWSRAGDAEGDTFCVTADKDFLKKHGVFKYKGRVIQRTVVDGTMNSKNIYNACQKNGMRPVCDHANYYDGLCEQVGGNRHFSHPRHAKTMNLPSKSLEGAYMYAGQSHGGRKSLKHLKRSHRWSNNNDEDGHTLCTKPAEEPDMFDWNDWELVRVRVAAKVNSKSIAKACAEKGMRPLCDHFAYSDGTCRAAPKGLNANWHFSYPSHDRRYKVPVDKVKGVFFYTGKSRGGRSALINTGRTHRWSPEWAHGVDTMCVRRNKAYLKKHKGDWGKLVPGMIIALKGGHRNRYCADEGNRIKCNRNSVGGWERFTTHAAGKEQGVIALKGGRGKKYCSDNHYMQCNSDKIGKAEKWTEYNVDKERMAISGGKHGKYCADEINRVRCNRGGIGGWERFRVVCIRNCASMEEQVDEKKYGKFRWRGRTVQRVKVEKNMNSKNIYGACAARGMRPVCDHANYFDGRCEVIGGAWHFSHPSHTRRFAKGIAKQSLTRVYMYCGHANGGKSLKHLKRSHRWSGGHDEGQYTLCTAPKKQKFFTWEGYELHRVQVKGTVTTQNILKACQSRSMSPLCDHNNYNDGNCKQIGGRWYFSHPSHDKRHGVDVNKVKWAFFYAGRANGNRALLNTGRTHRWTNGRQADGDTFCVKRSKDWRKKFGIFKMNGRTIERVEVKGQMRSEDIWRTCQEKGMRPVCDHAAYFDGRCVVVGMNRRHGQWHMSHPGHTRAYSGKQVKSQNVRRGFFYCGFSNRGWALRHGRRSHRWSNNKDRNQDTFCTKAPSRKNAHFQYKLWNLFRIPVKGEMRANNIAKACAAKSMRPVCDHKNYKTNACINMGNRWHWSHPHHIRRYAGIPNNKVAWAYFYASGNRALLNTGRTHRWYRQNHHGRDRDGDTFCAVRDEKRYQEYKKKFGTFKLHGHKITRVAVTGKMVSENIWRACKAKGLRPVCDHESYFDGRCVVLNQGHGTHNFGRWHMSYPHHTRRWARGVPRESLMDAYMYCGRANQDKSLLHKENGHRWSNNNDRDGETLCTASPNVKEDGFNFRGFAMHRITVKGDMTGHNIFKACEKKGMRPVCDHQNYKDKRCQSFGPWHWSHWNHLRHYAKGVDKKKVAHAYFYANGNRALVGRANSHRWARKTSGRRGGDRDGDTFCVKADEKWLSKFGVFKYKGRVIRRIQVRGVMNSKNIYNACAAKGMSPVCDHRNYQDGMCENIGGGWHWSHPHHTRRHAGSVDKQSLRGVFMYCGRANRGWSLLHKHNTHRWSNSRDESGQTLCTKPKKRAGVGKFEWRGYEFIRVKVKAKINSASIRKACKDNGMKPVCDHRNYNDKQCHSFNNGWHFSYPHHIRRYARIDQRKVQNVAFYAGRANSQRALVNTGRSHVWTQGWESNMDTMCVQKSKDFLKKHGMFKFNGFQIKRMTVAGEMNSRNIFNTCRKAGLRPVCDHANYFDGACVVVGMNRNHGRWHMSHPSHKRSYGRSIPSKSVQGAFMYCGSAHRQKSLQHLFSNSHRWSNNGDRDGDTLCTKEHNNKLDTFHFRGYKFTRTKVKGPMDGNNIYKACHAIGLRPVCDHQNYKDSRCKSFGNWHFSHPSHARRQIGKSAGFKLRYLNWAFFYANSNRALLNNGHSHRWSNRNRDHDGDTFCVADKVDQEYLRKHGTAKYKGKEVTRVQVEGIMNSKNIYKACAKKDMRPVCDHANYADGMCEVLGGSWHFSHPHHTKRYARKFSKKHQATLNGLFMYCGTANRGWSLLHRAHDHRWSNSRDAGGSTLCTKPPPEGKSFDWRGFEFKRVRVKEAVNSGSIRKACEKLHMKPVCDHRNYADGRCQNFGNGWHFSHPSHIRRYARFNNKKVQNVFFYAGRANHNRALVNTGRTHRWTRGWERDVDTMCVRQSPAWLEKYGKFTYNGKKIERIQFKGVANSKNLYAACSQIKMRPVCNHRNYADGMCENIGGNWHWSYPHHTNRHAGRVPREALQGVYTYCGFAHGQRALKMRYNNGHRWSNNRDKDGFTLCIRPSSQTEAPFYFRGYDFHRVRVHKHLNSASIRAACSKQGMKPVCDHKNYNDGHCKSFGNGWHFSYPHHIRHYAKFNNKRVQNVAFYAGRANHQRALFNTGRTHVWSRGWEKHVETMCVKRSKHAGKYSKFTLNGFKIERVQVDGTMVSQNIFKACKAKGMRPVCDHANYFDGRCVVVGLNHNNGQWHMSHNSHTNRWARKVKKESLQGAFMYCGRANHWRSLEHRYEGSHRWSNNRDRDSATLCTTPQKAKKSDFSFMGMKFHRVGVSGKMNGHNILKACKSQGMMPVCDHRGHSDKNCKSFGNWHWSHPHHVKHYAKGVNPKSVLYAYFYVNRNRAMVSQGRGHRWYQNGRDFDGDTFCVTADKEFLKKYGVFKFKGYPIERVEVKGRMYSKNIYNACANKGLIPVCDHSHYADGMCEVVGGGWHFSHPHHTRRHARNIPQQSLLGAYMYCGHANGRRSLYHEHNTHRWSNNNDHDGHTLCTKPKEKTGAKFDFMGYEMQRIKVAEPINSHSIVKACRAKGMKPVCDHNNYADGKCHNFGNGWHFSHPSHIRRYAKFNNKKVQNVFFYAGRANHRRALVNTGRTHKWNRGWEFNADTLCTRQSPGWLKKYGSFTLNKYSIQVTKVKGIMNSQNLWSACKAKGMRPVCDHAAYFDGRCEVVNMNHNYGRWHMSHPHHTRRWARGVQAFSLMGVFMYAGKANHWRSLQHLHNTHRWSNNNNRDGNTLCTRAKSRKRDSFTYRAHKFHRVRVHGWMTGNNINRACQAKGMQPVCDHQAYQDRRCRSFGRWHWSHPHHVRHHAGVDNNKLKWAYFYANGNRALLNNGHSHRWFQRGRDRDGDTFCVEPDKEFLKKHGMFKYRGYTIKRLEFNGIANSKNLYAACRKQGLKPVCDHANYADGLCEVVGGGWHVSYPHHTRHHMRGINKASLEGAYMYCGRANRERTLLHERHRHRWSNNNDRNGHTLCTKAKGSNGRTGAKFDYQGYSFVRVMVKSTINSASIRAACKAKKMKPVCDHRNYRDGHCKSFGNNWHWSHPHHIRHYAKVDQRKVQNVFFYAGRANHNRALINTGRTHMWSRGWENHADTMCVARDPNWARKYGTFKWRGNTIRRINVRGQMNSPNIFRACAKHGLLPVCDHNNYADGNCEAIGGRWHFSHPHHTNRHGMQRNRPSLIGAYIYAGTANRYRSLKHMSRSHRWSNHRDRNGQTLCTAARTKTGTRFRWRNKWLQRVKVRGTINAHTIIRACRKVGMKPVCDHRNYVNRELGDSKDAKGVATSKSEKAENEESGVKATSVELGDSEETGESDGVGWGGRRRRARRRRHRRHRRHWGRRRRHRVRRVVRRKTNCYNFNNNWHLSYPAHVRRNGRLDNKLVQNVFFYAGKRNRGRALVNTGFTHRWTNGRQRDGDTLCTK
jgi:hypothetical protein